MKLIRSFRYAWAGLRYCFATQLNFRLHCLFAAIAVILGCALRIGKAEWLILCAFIALVPVLEMINTAIEKLCDLVHPGEHPQIKIIKDLSAAAVLIAALASLAAGMIIFIPRLYQLL